MTYTDPSPRGILRTRMNFLKQLIFTAALAVLPYVLGWADEGAILWEADFSNLQPGPAPEFGASVEIKEQDGVKFLTKDNEETEFLFAKSAAVVNPQMWGDHVFKIRFRASEKVGLSIVVKARGSDQEVPYMQYYVSIGQDGFGLICHGLAKDTPGIDAEDPRRSASVSYEDLGSGPLPVGEWIDAKVAVGENVIKVSATAGDGQERKTEFKVFSGNGGVSVLTRSPVDIQSVTVREAETPVVETP